MTNHWSPKNHGNPKRVGATFWIHRYFPPSAGDIKSIWAVTVDGISPGWFGITQPTVGKKGRESWKTCMNDAKFLRCFGLWVMHLIRKLSFLEDAISNSSTAEWWIESCNWSVQSMPTSFWVVFVKHISSIKSATFPFFATFRRETPSSYFHSVTRLWLPPTAAKKTTVFRGRRLRLMQLHHVRMKTSQGPFDALGEGDLDGILYFTFKMFQVWILIFLAYSSVCNRVDFSLIMSYYTKFHYAVLFPFEL